MTLEEMQAMTQPRKLTIWDRLGGASRGYGGDPGFNRRGQQDEMNSKIAMALAINRLNELSDPERARALKLENDQRSAGVNADKFSRAQMIANAMPSGSAPDEITRAVGQYDRGEMPTFNVPVNTGIAGGRFAAPKFDINALPQEMFTAADNGVAGPTVNQEHALRLPTSPTLKTVGKSLVAITGRGDNLSANPLYTDPSSEDFTLGPGAARMRGKEVLASQPFAPRPEKEAGLTAADKASVASLTELITADPDNAASYQARIDRILGGYPSKALPEPPPVTTPLMTDKTPTDQSGPATAEQIATAEQVAALATRVAAGTRPPVVSAPPRPAGARTTNAPQAYRPPPVLPKQRSANPVGDDYGAGDAFQRVIDAKQATLGRKQSTDPDEVAAQRELGALTMDPFAVAQIKVAQNGGQTYQQALAKIRQRSKK